MVIEAKVENIKEIVDFSWEFACCKERRGFKQIDTYRSYKISL